MNVTTESYHRQLRKVTKEKSIFPTDEALLKMIYLATQDVLRKWTGRIQGARARFYCSYQFSSLIRLSHICVRLMEGKSTKLLTDPYKLMLYLNT